MRRSGIDLQQKVARKIELPHTHIHTHTHARVYMYIYISSIIIISIIISSSIISIISHYEDLNTT
jgi:hypothetical protein